MLGIPARVPGWGSYLLDWRWGDTTPTCTVHSPGFTNCRWLWPATHEPPPGVGRWLRGVSESSGLPLGEAGLGHMALPHVRAGGMDGKGAPSSMDPQPRSNLPPEGPYTCRVATGGKKDRGDKVFVLWLFLFCVFSFRVCFWFSRATDYGSSPAKSAVMWKQK